MNIQFEVDSRGAMFNRRGMAMSPNIGTLKKLKKNRDEIMNNFTNNLQEDLENMMEKKPDPFAIDERAEFCREDTIDQQIEKMINSFNNIKDPFEMYQKARKALKKQNIQIQNRQLREFIFKKFNPKTLEKLITFEQFAFDSVDRQDPLVKNLLKDMRNCYDSKHIKGSNFTVTDLWSKRQMIESGQALDFEKDRMVLLRYSSLNAAKIKEAKKKEAILSVKAEAKIKYSEANAYLSAHSPKNMTKIKAVEEKEARYRMAIKMSNKVKLNAELVKDIKSGIQTGIYDRKRIFHGSDQKINGGDSSIKHVDSSMPSKSGSVYQIRARPLDRQSSLDRSSSIVKETATMNRADTNNSAFGINEKNMETMQDLDTFAQDRLPTMQEMFNTDKDIMANLQENADAEFENTEPYMKSMNFGFSKSFYHLDTSNIPKKDTSIDKSPTDMKTAKSKFAKTARFGDNQKSRNGFSVIERSGNNFSKALKRHPQGSRTHNEIVTEASQEYPPYDSKSPKKYLGLRQISQTSIRTLESLKRDQRHPRIFQDTASTDSKDTLMRIKNLMFEATTLQKTNLKDIK